MVFGCLTCLEVIKSIKDAYHLDFSNGPGQLTLKQKLLEWMPGLIVNIRNASLCKNCVDIVNRNYDLKQIAFQSQSKIVTYLNQNPHPEKVALEDIANWYKTPSTSVVSDYDVNLEPAEPDAAPVVRWEPPLPLEEDKKVMKCKLCNYTCNEHCMHAFHMILHEFAIPPYKCGRCTAQLMSKEKLLDHLAYHSKETPYKCGVCFFETDRFNRMKDHQDVHQMPFYCTTCKKRFRLESEKKLHTHNSECEKFTCSYCGKKLKGLVAFKQHKRFHLTCKKCGHVFTSIMQVNTHRKEKRH